MPLVLDNFPIFIFYRFFDQFLTRISRVDPLTCISLREGVIYIVSLFGVPNSFGVKHDLKMTLWEGLFFPGIVFFLKKKNQRQHRRNRAQKEVQKSEFSLELIFCIVKTENRVLPKNWNVDGNFQSKTRIWVKTS